MELKIFYCASAGESSRHDDELHLDLRNFKLESSKVKKGLCAIRTQDPPKKVAAPCRSSSPGSLIPDSETTLRGSVIVSLDKSLPQPHTGAVFTEDQGLLNLIFTMRHV